MTAKPRGLARDPLAAREEMAARANEALGLDMPPPSPARPAPAVVASLPSPAPPAAPATTATVKQQDEAPAAPSAPIAAPVERPTPEEPRALAEQPAAAEREQRRTAKGVRTGTFSAPYERRDGVRTAKVSFQASLEFFQELRRFEAELPPKTRNAWMEKALRQAIARTRTRWEKAREAKAAGLPPPADDEG